MIQYIILRAIIIMEVLRIFIMAAKFFKKIQPGKMKLKDAEKKQNVFKSNLKPKQQKSALENLKLLYESRKALT